MYNARLGISACSSSSHPARREMKRPRGFDAEAAERKRRRTIAVERSAIPASLDDARLLQARAFETTWRRRRSREAHEAQGQGVL